MNRGRPGRTRAVRAALGLAAFVTGGLLAVLFAHRGADRSLHYDPDAPLDPAIPLAPFAVPSPPAPGTLTESRLPNGLRLLVIEDHRLPRVSCDLWLDAGRAREPLPGVAELTASMLMEGTKTRTNDELTDDVERLGASMNAAADEERTAVWASGLSEHTAPLLGLMADVVLHPAFRPERVNVLVRRWPAHDVNVQSPSFVVRQVAPAALYGKGPYATRNANARDVAALTTADLAAFWRQRYRSDDAVLAVAGDVRPGDVRRLVRNLFGGWTAGGKSSPDPGASVSVAEPPPGAPRPVHLVDWAYETEAYVSVQCLTAPEGSPDYYPLLVADTVLGGHSGRLAVDLREDRQLTYGASAHVTSPAGRPGIWETETKVPVDDVDFTLRTVERQMDRLRTEPVRAAELERARREIVGRSLLAREDPDSRMAFALAAASGGLPAGYYDDYERRIAAVTPEDIQRVASRYFKPERVQEFVVGPRSKLEAALKRHGDVQVYDERGLAKF